MEDMNSRGYLERVKNIVLEHIREVGGPPSVQMSGRCLVIVDVLDDRSRLPRHPTYADRRCNGRHE